MTNHIKDTKGWEERLMDEFCVTFERAQDDTVVESLEKFIVNEKRQAQLSLLDDLRDAVSSDLEIPDTVMWKVLDIIKSKKQSLEV